MRRDSPKGTPEWFEASRRRCVDHLRALLAISASKSSITEILRGWDIHSAEIRSALHSACVMSYARPFSSSDTGSGKIFYPTKQLLKTIDFDVELHKHILSLRDRIIAHGDYGIFPSAMYLQAIGDERLPVTLGINVKGMLGIASRDLASRYEKHIAICARRLEEVLSQECNELAVQAKLDPNAFNSTHNIPEISREIDPFRFEFLRSSSPRWCRRHRRGTVISGRTLWLQLRHFDPPNTATGERRIRGHN